MAQWRGTKRNYLNKSWRIGQRGLLSLCVAVSFLVGIRHFSGPVAQAPPIAVSIFRTPLSYQSLTISHLCVTQPKSLIHILCIQCINDIGLETFNLTSKCRGRVSVHTKPSKHFSTLESLYTHISVNPEEYERFCILRFSQAADLVRRLRLSSVVLLDTDILLFNEAHNILPRGTSLVKYSSYFVHWSKSSLLQFEQFLIAFYRSALSEQVKLSNELGYPQYQVNVSVGSEILVGNHISDMHLLLAFQEKIGGLEIICNPSCPPEFDGINDAHDLIACDGTPLSNITWEMNPGARFLRPIISGVKVEGLHLQGECKSLVHAWRDELDNRELAFHKAARSRRAFLAPDAV